jgi:hypothetical protein
MPLPGMSFIPILSNDAKKRQQSSVFHATFIGQVELPFVLGE